MWRRTTSVLALVALKLVRVLKVEMAWPMRMPSNSQVRESRAPASVDMRWGVDICEVKIRIAAGVEAATRSFCGGGVVFGAALETLSDYSRLVDREGAVADLDTVGPNGGDSA